MTAPVSPVKTLPEAPAGPRRDPWSWAPATEWRCPRCGQLFLTREAGPTCFYREGT